jgi:hypothetical protein
MELSLPGPLSYDQSVRRAFFTTMAMVVLVVGCGDDASNRDGAATDTADGGLGIAPPASPLLTVDGRCPDNWNEVNDGSGPITCEPWAHDADTTCPTGEAWFVGESGCAPIGTPCPTGDFAEDLPEDRAVLYVQIAEGGQLDLANGRVRGHPIAACVQADGYDLGRLSDDVVYEDNDSNIQTTNLPVPAPVSPIDG